MTAYSPFPSPEGGVEELRRYVEEELTSVSLALRAPEFESIRLKVRESDIKGQEGDLRWSSDGDESWASGGWGLYGHKNGAFINLNQPMLLWGTSLGSAEALSTGTVIVPSGMIEWYDPFGWGSGGRITFGETARIKVSVAGEMEDVGTGKTGWIGFSKNGTANWVATFEDIIRGAGWMITSVSSNDYVEPVVYQDSGSTKNLLRLDFLVERVG